MKIGKRLPALIRRLNELSLISNASLVTRAGFPDECIMQGTGLLYCEEVLGYLATLLVKNVNVENTEVSN
jgi:precorrin-2 methylase